MPRKAKKTRKRKASSLPRKSTGKRVSVRRVAKKKAPRVKKSGASKISRKKSVAGAPAKPSKKALDHAAKAERLLARGRERGFVTYDEILKEFPTIEDDVLFLEELYEKLNTAGGGVLERRGHARARGGRAGKEKRLRRTLRFSLRLDTDVSARDREIPAFNRRAGARACQAHH